MDKNKKYKNFDELFEDALYYKAVKLPKYEKGKEVLRQIDIKIHELKFIDWLQKNGFVWEQNDGNKFLESLTKSNIIKYLQFDKKQKAANKIEYEKEEKTWKVKVHKVELMNQINYFHEWSTPFRFLHNIITSVSEVINPIYPKIIPLKYFKYFLQEINYHNIGNSNIDIRKEEIEKYFISIHYGLKEIFQRDINEVIRNFQENIPKLSKEQANEIQKKIIGKIGMLKRNYDNTILVKNFDEQFREQLNSIRSSNENYYIDYVKLVLVFNDEILIEIMKAYEIINETLEKINPFLISVNLVKDEKISENNIYPLTKDNLLKFGFSLLDSENILKSKSPVLFFLLDDKGNYCVNMLEKRIYVGQEALRKHFFGNENQIAFPILDLSLVSEYYDLSLNKYLNSKRKLLGNIYNEDKEKENFREIQIKQAENSIKNEKTPINKEKYQGYLDYLNNPNNRLSSNFINDTLVPPSLVNAYNSFEDIFTVSDWRKYVNLLCETTPKLLNEAEGKFIFVGNKKTQSGCVGQYFAQLKSKGIISSTVNRDILAEILSKELVNFSISGVSINNESIGYKKTFAPQLNELLKGIT